MVDERFFHRQAPIELQAIAALTGAVIASRAGTPHEGNPLFHNVSPLDRAGANDISFLDNIKYIDTFTHSNAGACFVRAKYVERAPANMVLLVTDEPYYSYAVTARKFYPDAAVVANISPLADIAASATIGKDVRIDRGAIIGEHVTIGDRCWIGSGTHIDHGVTIGNDTRIGANCTLSHTVIGQRTIIHRGVHIGQDGFGFALGAKGIVKIPQLGRVMVSDDVEIGSGTCIDRGTGPDTVIGHGSKIDNLVQIGHNVQIGKHVIIAAQCGIAGSTHIGDGAMLGGQVGISGHVRIGAGVKLAAQSGVMTDIPAGSTYGGSPAMPVKDWHRQTVAMSKMAKRKDASEE